MPLFSQFGDHLGGVVLDFDANGALVGTDIQHASLRADIRHLSVSKLPLSELRVAQGRNSEYQTVCFDTDSEAGGKDFIECLNLNSLKVGTRDCGTVIGECSGGPVVAVRAAWELCSGSHCPGAWDQGSI
jgi:hypothetical protein